MKLTAGDAPIEGLPALDRLSARLAGSEGELRLALMESMITRGGPLDEAELGTLPELARFDLVRDYPALSEKQLLVSAQGQIRVVYPVSALPTRHRVYLADGRSFHAMCAIDALGSAFTFRQDIAIRSRCSHCETPIRMEVFDGRLAGMEPDGVHVLHVDLSRYGDWSGSC